ncbi:hypothetical protein BDR05DRAFT_800158 [Suillus weaverae]|nr:hypothetical protein BDR05DRAFT_800158 [Suillus weaverae]
MFFASLPLQHQPVGTRNIIRSFKLGAFICHYVLLITASGPGALCRNKCCREHRDRYKRIRSASVLTLALPTSERLKQ